MIQEPRHILLISGGKDSTALALYMRDHRPEVDLEYVFCDTQKELPETYAYLAKIEAYLQKPVTRLCSDLGDRGFDHHLKVYGNYLPSPNMRWCTKKLKIEPFEKFLGDDAAYLYIGIRADERREGYISAKPNVIPVYPFKEDGIIKEDVLRILEDSGVGMPDYYEWRSRSGCYFCFFQRRSEWVGLKERHPDLFQIAKSYEKPEEGYTWLQGHSLDEFEDPQTAAEIKRKDQERKARVAERRKPRNLAEVFGAATDEDPDEESACLICHL
jgi:3'-phosphoadenosine 5'-phosphosulfate sulfotransferase (PAPS reductase)/FAD synthetase